MGRIEDKHRERKHKDVDNPLGEFGDRNEKTNKVYIDEKTIKGQQNKE
ncbi:hypothetical protein RBU60_07760 [Mesonia sp. MT50]|uniref:Uncharacterized protein n=1 Tax=Mesonia profundi TaxID=3070998 RepID=A0ABU1A2I2_9FLAO|nr:hypothetical protein [Mesonia profundi]MDQ7917466.1 hypothetical protein [Mesonia profundi]